MYNSEIFLKEKQKQNMTFKGRPPAALGPTFCFGLTRANTLMWGKRVWSSRGSQHSLASPSPVTHRSNWCTNEETEGGGSGTCTVPSMDSHCHLPGKKTKTTSVVHNFVYVLDQNTCHKWITTKVLVLFSYFLNTDIVLSSNKCDSVNWWLTLIGALLQYKCVFFLDEVELSRYMARC